MEELHPRKILIVKLGAVGDCVHTLYALSALRKKFPAAEIGWAVEEKSWAVAAGHPDVDHVHRIVRSQGWIGWLKSARAVAGVGYDTAVDFSNLFKSGYIALRSGAECRIGFDRFREGNFLFVNRRIKSSAGHMIERYFSLLAPLGIEQIPERVAIFVPEEKKRTIDAFFDEKIDSTRPVVLLNPHGTWENKLYPTEKYGSVADRLIRQGNQVILAWGGNKERRVVERMAGNMEEPAIVAPPTDLKELHHLLSRSTIYLGNDTGPMHMAAAAGIGVAAVFGPTDPARVGPWTKRARVVTLKGVCEKWPCEKRKCGSPDCITRIDPDAVYDAAMSLIEEGA